MQPCISLVSLGVMDVAASTAFYEALGFAKSRSASVESTTFLKAGGAVISLFGRQALTDDLHAAGLWTGNGGVALAWNLPSEAGVDAAMSTAESAGARILKPAARTDWGGYAGAFADPDGHAWEIAHNPFFPLDDDGRIDLPD
jgi:predicted lactoylglutathione lyase